MSKTYKITFHNKATAALFLWELHAWDIGDSRYQLNTMELVFYHCGADVVDVLTETFHENAYILRTEQK